MFEIIVRTNSQTKILNDVNGNYFILKLLKYWVLPVIFYDQIYNNFKKKNFDHNKKLKTKDFLTGSVAIIKILSTPLDFKSLNIVNQYFEVSDSPI